MDLDCVCRCRSEGAGDCYPCSSLYGGKFLGDAYRSSRSFRLVTLVNGGVPDIAGSTAVAFEVVVTLLEFGDTLALLSLGAAAGFL